MTPNCAGFPNMELTVCSFVTGVIKCALSELTWKEVSVVEERCGENGYSSCQFATMIQTRSWRGKLKIF